jgi:hypothetical protein
MIINNQINNNNNNNNNTHARVREGVGLFLCFSPKFDGFATTHCGYNATNPQNQPQQLKRD